MKRRHTHTHSHQANTQQQPRSEREIKEGTPPTHPKWHEPLDAICALMCLKRVSDTQCRWGCRPDSGKTCRFASCWRLICGRPRAERWKAAIVARATNSTHMNYCYVRTYKTTFCAKELKSHSANPSSIHRAWWAMSRRKSAVRKHIYDLRNGW